MAGSRRALAGLSIAPLFALYVGLAAWPNMLLNDALLLSPQILHSCAIFQHFTLHTESVNRLHSCARRNQRHYRASKCTTIMH